MTVKHFVDTNIFVYLFSKTENAKRAKCQEFITQIGLKGGLVISAQVISEFSAVMLRKFNMPASHLKSIVESLDGFETIAVTKPIVERAIEIHALNQISFWDSQIVSAAKSAHCQAVISEDLNHGQKIEGLEIINPMLL